ncbi:asparagine synthase (glutamine-hydrolyzing) [Candidatus Parcubacteria bacterium]|nr:MAG: asparagine synthase (glutamine-hydrolyzing) [Candidatus Parcubacteria bacterium]
MCGIAGSNDENFILGKNDLKHRGPDSFNAFKERGMNFYHWRLAIIDPTENGNQPIFNEDKTISAIFNGEIYNYLELRDKYLKKHQFYTNTDTEVIVHMYEEFGERFVDYLNGDFAISLWDNKTNTLFLYRDRLGIKPLYYTSERGKLYFASEIKPLLKAAHLKQDRELDFCSIDSYLRYRYILSPEDTFFKRIKKLLPGHFLVWNTCQFEIKKYWDVKFLPNPAIRKEEYVAKFASLFSDSVRLRMISDVPVGAYLSGGIDSNSVVAEMKKHNMAEYPIRTFSIGFKGSTDETFLASKYAAFHGTNHQSFYLKPDDYKCYKELVHYLDELVGDPIILPTYILSKMASETVKVVLTGEGADEILGSYIHHYAVYYVSKYWTVLPNIFKNIFIVIMKLIPHNIFNKIFPYPADLGKNGKEKVIAFLKNSKGNLKIADLIELFNEDERKKLFNIDLNIFHFDRSRNNIDSRSINDLLTFDLKHWLPNYTLLKQDRLAMANGIESRSPFLDHRLVELVSQIPDNLRVKNFKTKVILRQAMSKKLTKKITKAKKKAFYLPLTAVFDENFWLFVKDILSKKNIEKIGILNYTYINQLLGEEKNLLNTKKIFNIFLLQLWFDEFIASDKKI